MANLIIEGQTHTVPDALVLSGATTAEQDEQLRNALRPNFALAANATFKREQPEGGELTVTVIKSPGTKGGDQHAYTRIVGRLLCAPDALCGGFALACEMHILEMRLQLDMDALVDLQPRMERVLATGAREQEQISRASRVLAEARAIASSGVPAG